MVVADTNYRVAGASGIFVFLVYISRGRVGRAEGCVTVPPVKDTARFIETRCGKCADICMSGRSKTLEESFDTKNKGGSVRSPRSALRASVERSSRGAINRRKQSLIFWNFNSQSVKRASLAYGTNKTSPRRVLRKAGFKRRASNRLDAPCIYAPSNARGRLKSSRSAPLRANLDTCVCRRGTKRSYRSALVKVTTTDACAALTRQLFYLKR